MSHDCPRLLSQLSHGPDSEVSVNSLSSRSTNRDDGSGEERLAKLRLRLAEQVARCIVSENSAIGQSRATNAGSMLQSGAGVGEGMAAL